MRGINRTTGKALEGVEHLKQSIQDILTTPVGSRVMRRTYGSRLFELIDNPLSRGLLVDIYTETAVALDKWEPRFKLERVEAITANESGKIELEIEGLYLPDGKRITLEGIIL